MKKYKNIKIGLIVAILLLAVGFAAVTTTLTINGNVPLKNNTTDFTTNVTFSDEEGKAPTLVASDSSKTASAPTLSSDKKTISFTTPELDTINETVTLSYHVKNDSQYKLQLGEMKCTATRTGATDTDPVYIAVTPKNNYKDQALDVASTTENADTVEIKMTRSYAGESNISYEIACSMTATATE